METRGLRNKNLLNIRIGNVWMGEVPDPTDTEFEQFTDIVWGLRAGFVILRRYIEHYHRRTIREILYSWAPPSENHTLRYVSSVSAMTGIDPDEVLVFQDRAKMVQLVKAMCRVESGVVPTDEVVDRAYSIVNHT